MKLLPEQNEQLDLLCAHVQSSSFSQATRTLEALEHRPTPALIPALLPAFVPEAMRRMQNSSGWVNYTLRTIQLMPRSDEEARFREQLARFLARCLRHASGSQLLHLDDASRHYGSPRWPTNHWRWLDVRAVEWCLPEDPESRFALTALATFHGSGYVRERAIDLLEAETSGAELPFLLVRLNDWVDPVQRKAFYAVRSRIRDENAAHFARSLDLLCRLCEVRRNQLTDIIESALTLVSGPVGRPSLEALFNDSDRPLRRRAYRWASERFSDGDRGVVLRRALQEDDVGTRLWAARAALDSGLWFEEIAVDPCGAIRAWALRARVEREQAAAVPALRSALFDRAASVRGSARFHLSRFEPQLVIADVYRDALEQPEDASTLATAIAGLAEVGDRDDAALISFHVTSPAIRVAKAAVKACGRLARADCTRELVEALSDARVGVSRAARQALAEAPLQPALLADLIRTAVHIHTRLNALALVGSIERWERLIVYLGGLANERAEVREGAHTAVERWLAALLQSPYLPAPPPSAQQAQIRALLASMSDAGLRARLQEALSR